MTKHKIYLELVENKDKELNLIDIEQVKKIIGITDKKILELNKLGFYIYYNF